MRLEKELEIIKDYNFGLDVKVISKKHYYHVKTIYDVLKKHNIKLKQWEKTFNESQINKIIELYKSGETIEYISVYMGVSWQTIRKTLVKNNIEIKKVGGSKCMLIPTKKRLYYLIKNYSKKDIAYMYYVCVENQEIPSILVFFENS